jgi:hypothetical protein
MLFVVCALFSPVAVVAAEPTPQLPCDFSGELLRTTHGKVVQYTSAEMKTRATRKVDVGGFMKQLDIKGTVILDILVGVSGEVVCLKSLIGHPLIRAQVEKALRSWRFKQAEMSGKRVAYLGRLEFTLCNINCGTQGTSMTLLK